MRKALILGAKGNLGSQIVKQFALNYQLISLDRQDIDLFEIAKLASLLEQLKPAIIINTVAYNKVDDCESSKKEYQKALFLNERLPSLLANWCLEREATLMHYSSDYVFQSDKLNHQGFIESDRPKPINKYAWSKFLGEQKLLTLADKGLAFYLIRTSKLFGPIGQSENAKPSFFDIMIKLSQDNKSLKVVDNEKSCFTYTPDLAKASLNLLQDQAKYGIYHLINEEPATWYQALVFLFKHLGIKDVEIEAVKTLNRTAKRPTSSILINTKRNKLRPFTKALIEYYKP